MLVAELLQMRASPGAIDPSLTEPDATCSLSDGIEQARAVGNALRARHVERVGVLVSPGSRWVSAFFGALAAGAVAVPFSPLFPDQELAWLAEDAALDAIVLDHAHRSRSRAFSKPVLALETLLEHAAADPVALAGDEPGLQLYTSGTTGRPKGVVLRHRHLDAHVRGLIDRWGLGPHDRLLHALPLHHLHGIVVALMSCLGARAGIDFLPKFDADVVWSRIARGGASVFMGVPTMYQRLVETFDAADAPTQRSFREGARAMRLFTSGSAALPPILAERWRAIAGEVPLERYGMTEIGIALSNRLEPELRVVGAVGDAMPGYELRIAGDEGDDVGDGPGELWVRGPGVFDGYFHRPEATREAFVDGWFKTGDRVQRTDGVIRMLGRTSIDILKSGGEKISALEIEEAIRGVAPVREVAVVGLPDPRWGDRVVAVIVPKPGQAEQCALEVLKPLLAERIAAYKIPKQVVQRAELPKNAMGKVQKTVLVTELSAPGPGPAS